MLVALIEIVGSATANNNQVTGNLSAGKLTVLYDINAEISGFDLVHIDDDYTVWDGLKIYENEVLFTY